MAFINNGEVGSSVRASLNARFEVVSLIPVGGFIATNAALGSVFNATVAGDVTLSTPTGMSDGQTLSWNFLYSGDGHTIQLSSGFSVPQALRDDQSEPAVDGTKVCLKGTYSVASGKVEISDCLVTTED